MRLRVFLRVNAFACVSLPACAFACVGVCVRASDNLYTESLIKFVKLVCMVHNLRAYYSIPSNHYIFKLKTSFPF